MLFVREKQPSGHGATTTIATLQALAGIHAIADVLFNQYGICEYEKGVHATSVKAWMKHVSALEKPQKEDIREYLLKKHPEIQEEISLDISDSIALAECLIAEKWNNDLKEQLKEEKKHLKALKSVNAIEKQKEKIAILEEKLI